MPLPVEPSSRQLRLVSLGPTALHMRFEPSEKHLYLLVYGFVGLGHLLGYKHLLHSHPEVDAAVHELLKVRSPNTSYPNRFDPFVCIAEVLDAFFTRGTGRSVHGLAT